MISAPAQAIEIQSLHTIASILAPRDGEARDVMGMEIGEFTKLAELFKQIFSNNFNHFGFQQIRSNLNNIRQTQVEAIWLYVAFSIYVHHWAKDQRHAKTSVQKLQIINELDKIAYPFIGNTLKSVNDAHVYHFQRHPLVFHQRLLMVQGTLFTFIQNLAKNKNIELHNALVQIPLSLTPEKLAISQSKTKERNASGASYTEQSVNTILLENLKNVPEIFQPIKKVTDELFINDWGLELDFPLKSKITIETDGIYHLTRKSDNPRAVHNIVHNLKAFLLRENGWIRVPVNVHQGKCVELAEKISQLLHIPRLQKFKDQYDELIKKRNWIQNSIIETQNKMKLPSESAYKTIHLNYITQLLAQDAIIQQFIEKRHLEIVLRDPDTKELKAALTFYHQYLLQEQNKIAKGREISDLFNKKDQLEKQIKAFEDEMQKSQEQIAKDEILLANLFSTLKKIQEEVEKSRSEKIKISPENLKQWLEILSRVGVEKKSLEERIVQNRAKIESLKAQIESLNQSISGLNKHISDQVKIFKTMEKKIQALKKELKEIEDLKKLLPVAKIIQIIVNCDQSISAINKFYQSERQRLEESQKQKAMQAEKQKSMESEKQKSMKIEKQPKEFDQYNYRPLPIIIRPLAQNNGSDFPHPAYDSYGYNSHQKFRGARENLAPYRLNARVKNKA